MVLDPTAQIETESPAEEISPGFFSGELPPPPADAPDEIQVAGAGAGVRALMKGALKKVGDAEAQGDKFARPGSAESEAVPDITGGGIEPGGLAPDHQRFPGADDPLDADGNPIPLNVDGDPVQPAPLSATSDPAQVGNVNSKVGLNDKEVSVRIDEAKEAEVSKVYKRFTTDTPFSALDDFNARRMETDQDVMAVIASRSQVYAAEIANETGGKISQKATKHVADLIGASPGQLTKKILGGKLTHTNTPGELAANMLAARDLMIFSAGKVDTLSKLVAKLDNADDLVAAGFSSMEEAVMALNRQSALHVALQAKIKGAETDIARTMSAFNIMSDGGALKNQNIQELVTSSGGVDLARQRAQMYVALEDPIEQQAFLRRSMGAKTADALYEAWINGLLSSPITHMVNIVSNLLHMTGQHVVRGAAGAMGRARRKKTGRNNGVRGGEGTAMSFAYSMAMRDAVKMAGAVFKDPSGEIMAKVEPGRKYRHNNFSAEGMEQSGNVGRAWDLAGNVLTLGRAPTRGLAAGDVFFKVLGQRMELYARAWRDTVSEFGEGTVGVTDEFTDALAHRIANPSAEVQQATIDFGQMVTFTGQLGEFGQKAQGIGANGFIRWFVPFIKTPANIITTAWEYTPMNAATQKFRTAIAAGGAEADLAKARISLGTGVMMTVSGLSMAGLITGGGPSDAKLRANKMRQGWRPYSIKIGDRYIPYKRIEPFATVLGIAADLTEITSHAIDKQEFEKVGAALAIALAKNVTSKTYMEGFSRLIDVIQNPDRYAGATIDNFVRTIMPRAGAFLEHQADPELRYVRSTLDALRQDTLGWSETLPNRVDLWGNPMIRDSFWGSVDAPNDLDAELDRLEIAIDEPGETIPMVETDYELPPQMYHDYSVVAGKLAIKSMKTVMSRPDYKVAGDEKKKIMVRQAFRSARRKAAGWLYEDSKHAERLGKIRKALHKDKAKRLTQ